MAGDTIREFLVALGFKTDQDSLDRFTRAVEGATLRAKLLGDAFEGMAQTALKSVADTATGFEQLYWQSQRIGASVGSIRAFSYAVSQLGGDARQANANLESFGQFLKYNPGTRNLISGRLGHRIEREDTGQVAVELGAYLRTLSVPQQKLQATQMHLDDLTYNAVINPNFQRWYNEERSRGDAANVGKTSEDAVKFEQQYRDAVQKFSDAAAKFADQVLPKLTDGLDKLNKWLDEHQKQVSQVAETAGEHGPQAFGAITGALTGGRIAGWPGALVGAILGASAPQTIEEEWVHPEKYPHAADTRPLLRKIWNGITSFFSPSKAEAEDLPVGVGPQWNGINAALPTGKDGLPSASAPHVNGSPVSDSNPMPVRVVEITATQGGGGGLFGWLGGMFGGGGGGGGSGGLGGAPSGIRARAIGGTPTGQEAELAKQAYQYWRSQGLTHEQALAVVGNQRGENALGGLAAGDGGRSVGQFQWDPRRRAQILAGTGIDVATAGFLDQQRAARWEMENSPDAVNRIWGGLKGAKSVDDAVGILVHNYERSGNQIGDIALREGYAYRYGKIIKDSDGSAASGDGVSHPYASAYDAAKGGHFVVRDPTGQSTYPAPGEKVLGGKPPAAWPSAPSAWQGIDSLLPVGGGTSNVKNNNVSSSVINNIHIESADPATAAAMVGDHMDRTAQHIMTNLQGAVQ